MNKSQKNSFFTTFSIIFLGNILTHLLDIPVLETISKPMIMLSLLAYFYLNTKGTSFKKLRGILITSIIFSWFGDVSLLLESTEKPYFFILGLGSFLVAHVLYVIAFYQMTQKQKGFVQKNPFWLIVFLVFGGGIYVFLLPQLKELALPVFVYMLSIVSMSVFALNLKGLIRPTLFNMIFIGSLLFIFSDTCIAINKFVLPFNLARVTIMSSYILAQLLIIITCTSYFSTFKSKKHQTKTIKN